MLTWFFPWLCVNVYSTIISPGRGLNPTTFLSGGLVRSTLVRMGDMWLGQRKQDCFHSILWTLRTCVSMQIFCLLVF